MTVTSSNSARRTAAWLVAIALWAYAALGAVLGLAVMLFLPLAGLACILGSSGIALSTLYARRGRRVLAGLLLVVGGITVGGTIGVFVAAWEHVELDVLALGFVLGAAGLGGFPILVGVGLIGWHLVRRKDAVPEEPEPRRL